MRTPGDQRPIDEDAASHAGRGVEPRKKNAVGMQTRTVCEAWKSVAIAQEDRARPSRRCSTGPERGPPNGTIVAPEETWRVRQRQEKKLGRANVTRLGTRPALSRRRLPALDGRLPCPRDTPGWFGQWQSGTYRLAGTNLSGGSSGVPSSVLFRFDMWLDQRTSAGKLRWSSGKDGEAWGAAERTMPGGHGHAAREPVQVNERWRLFCQLRCAKNRSECTRVLACCGLYTFSAVAVQQ